MSWRRLRSLMLGVLGGVGTMALLLGIVALIGGIAAAAGAPLPFTTLAPPRSAAAILAAGAVAGAIVGGIAPRVRSPAGAALLGAVVTIAALGVIGALDPAAGGWAGALPAELDTKRIGLLLASGLPGLAAPLIWAAVRAAATRPIPLAVAEIAGRVGALVLALFAAVMCMPFLYGAMYGVIGGLRALPRVDYLLTGLGYVAKLIAAVAVSLLCGRLAGVPRGRGPLPGFERPPPDDLTRNSA